MKIELERNEQQVKLVQLMASKDKDLAYEAQAAITELLSPVIAQLLMEADPLTSSIYTDMPYNEGDDPAFPIDLFVDVPEGYFTIWSQEMAGGIPTNHLTLPVEEYRFTTYKIDSAVSYLKKYARKARMDVLGKALERLMQEILLKQQRNAWAPLLRSLIEARTDVNGVSTEHVIRANTATEFQLNDLNRMFTRHRRLNSAWAGGTPVESSGLTDLLVSPEVKEKIRSFAYNPINTKGANEQAGTADSGVVTMTEQDRQSLFNGGGTETLFTLTIHELLELGVDYRYVKLFGQLAGGNNVAGSAFDSSADDLAIGVDVNRDFAVRPLEVSDETGSTFTMQPDDQFLARSEKIGMYGSMREGRVILDMRPVVGLVI